MEVRLTRRMAGVLAARLPEAALEDVADPRQARGKRWPLAALLRAAVVGLVAGCRSTAETENLTQEMSRAMARSLGLRRRVPDTTLRDVLCQLAPAAVAGALHAQIRAAHRRKALAPHGLPFGVVAIDGKYTTVPDWDEDRQARADWDAYNEYVAQKQTHSEGGGSSRRIGTFTCSLVSSRAKPCIDAIPIAATTNEMGHFQSALTRLQATYGSLELYRLVSADAGMSSEANARFVVETCGLDYLFRLNDQQPTLLADAQRLLHRLPPSRAVAETEDIVGRSTVTRRLHVSRDMAGFLDWTHLRTVVRVQSVKTDIDTGRVLEREDRYYMSSLAADTLTADQWLAVVRAHWGVENNCHHTFDAVFREDERPWIVAHPKGMVNVLLLRRVAYNIAALFRSVTQRSEERRHTPWRDILRWFYNALIAANDADLEGLRPRPRAAATEV